MGDGIPLTGGMGDGIPQGDGIPLLRNTFFTIFANQYIFRRNNPKAIT